MIEPHTGLAAYRLHPDADNPREVAFAEQWKLENRTGRTLDHIIPHYNDRDEMIAATVIQWLGSNVGIAFLQDVIKREPKVGDILRMHK